MDATAFHGGPLPASTGVQYPARDQNALPRVGGQAGEGSLSGRTPDCQRTGWRDQPVLNGQTDPPAPHVQPDQPGQDDCRRCAFVGVFGQDGHRDWHGNHYGKQHWNRFRDRTGNQPPRHLACWLRRQARICRCLPLNGGTVLPLNALPSRPCHLETRSPRWAGCPGRLRAPVRYHACVIVSGAFCGRAPRRTPVRPVMGRSRHILSPHPAPLALTQRQPYVRHLSIVAPSLTLACPVTKPKDQMARLQMVTRVSIQTHLNGPLASMPLADPVGE